MSSIPKEQISPQDHDTSEDDPWPAITNLEFDATALFAEVNDAHLRAQAAQGQARRDSGPSPEQGSGAADVTTAAEQMPWPPGRAGRLARFLFQTSYSPIQEVAITATLGLLAGVCGRAYRTHTDMDVALYVILVAKSGVGKDALHKGIPMMLKLSERPLAMNFLRATDFASGEALHKALLREPGFLYLQGEFGKKLKRMANPTDSPMQSFRNIMLMAYGKEFLEGKEYSNAENSLMGVDWPALSFVGETTPGTFHECLTPDMMADGFMSRFLIVNYGGGRPLPNKHREAALDDEDQRAWSDLVDHAARYQFPINMPQAITVEPDWEAQGLLDQFDLDCISRLNATDDESERQVWSRAHVKVLKIASLLAVADHYLKPNVSGEHVRWAMDLVQMDVAAFQSRKQSGDIGVDDDARERKLVSFIRDYLLGPVAPSYGVEPKMVKDGVVPRKYLQMRSASLPAFRDHKLGASRALDDAIRSMIDNGTVMEVKRDKLMDLYGFNGRSFRPLNL